MYSGRILSQRKPERQVQSAQKAEHIRRPQQTSWEMAGQILQLQRTLGNWAVNQLLQRDDTTPAPDDTSGQQSSQQADLPPVDQQVALPTPDPIPVSPDDVGSGMGDYEVPDQSNVAMAKHLDGAPVVYRQNDQDASPKLGLDVPAGGSGTIVSPPPNPRTGDAPAAPAPFTIASTIVLRDFNIFQVPSLHLDFGHEPSFQVQIDPASGLSAQVAIALINLHWTGLWQQPVEASISPFVQTTLVPLAISQIGAQAQVEQHVTGTLSLTLTGSGAYQPPVPGQQGGLSLTAGAGVLLHFDWDKLP